MKSVILAGGFGTNLWPLSRKQYPKQFLKFKDYSMFQEAFLRCKQVSTIEEIFVVTHVDLKFHVVGQIQELGEKISWDNVIVEPASKNTLPAIYLAVRTIQSLYNEAIIGIYPSDHLLSKQTMKTITSAESIASNGNIVTFGNQASLAKTNYGYINIGRKKGIGNKVIGFHEKPDEITAKKYVKKGLYWNTGIFLFHTSTFLDELKKHSFEIFTIFKENKDINNIYKKISSVSFEKEILEKTKKLIMIPIKDHWNDIDNFSDLSDHLKKDEHGNVLYKTDFLSVNAKNDIVYGKKDKLVSLIDIQDMIVVDTNDALLISTKKQSFNVKEIVDKLKEKNDNRFFTGQTVYRPWGSYTVLESTPHHVIKKICVYPKHRLSLQLHHHRSEHWVVVKGTANVHVNGKDFIVHSGESTFIGIKEKHRLANLSEKDPLEIIEVQLGDLISEDDIVRFDDEYGRI